MGISLARDFLAHYWRAALRADGFMRVNLGVQFSDRAWNLSRIDRLQFRAGDFHFGNRARACGTGETSALLVEHQRIAGLAAAFAWQRLGKERLSLAAILERVWNWES